ncbi:nuclear transport factor 2 family protein [Tropicimonas sp. S265A]|uniref:nuclear transport factor 2 family protein n=1 Tax=Tropicimonas sp. S265A TaxID=3415134 RepID=UPI003C7A391A
MTPDEKIAQVHAYFAALTAGDTSAIVALFAKNAMVHSPFLGEVAAPAFFAKLAAASNGSNLKVFDVLLNADASSAAGHFRYDWTLASGDTLSFEGVDLFHFAPDGRFARMAIYYDTHPLREEVGDKYANA